MILHVLLATLRRDLLDELRGLEADGHVLVAVAEDASQAWEHLGATPCDLLVLDAEFLGQNPLEEFGRFRDLPDSPEVIVLLEQDDPEKRVEMLDAGAMACLALDIERHTLRRTIRALVRRTQRMAMREFIADEATPDSRLSDFASKSPSMQGFLALARKVVGTTSSLLVLGETGVGKEYLARAIHAEGPRGAKPFVAVNCAALPETLLESELFGHTAGAFTGAQKARRGYFELAHTGTVFLDEIGELPAHMQVKILRVLQDRLVQPIGSEKTIEVDVRVVAATNRDLKSDLQSGRFRSDLYYRLGVVSLRVPSLRERREDIPDLVGSHIEHFRVNLGRPVFGIRAEALDLLLRYDWPGNVRELINVVERAVLLADSDEIGVEDLPEDVQTSQASCGEHSVVREPSPADLLEESLPEGRERVVQEYERAYLEAMLRRTEGRMGEAAERAGITVRALYDKMKRLGLRKEAYRSTHGGGSSGRT